MSQKKDLTQEIKGIVRKQGVQLVGITPVEGSKVESSYQNYLKRCLLSSGK